MEIKKKKKVKAECEQGESEKVHGLMSLSTRVVRVISWGRFQ